MVGPPWYDQQTMAKKVANIAQSQAPSFGSSHINFFINKFLRVRGFKKFSPQRNFSEISFAIFQK